MTTYRYAYGAAIANGTRVRIDSATDVHSPTPVTLASDGSAVANSIVTVTAGALPVLLGSVSRVYLKEVDAQGAFVRLIGVVGGIDSAYQASPLVAVYWNGTNLIANGQVVGGGGTPSDTASPQVTSFTTSAGDSQVMLAWSGTDNVGITGWTLKRGGTTVYSGAATSYTDTGLTNGTQYSYTLTASDAAGNVSAASATTATPAAAASAGYGATPYGTGAYGQ